MASFNNSSFALLVFALVVAQMLAVAAAAPDGGVGHRKLLFGSDFDLQGLGQGLVNDLGSESIRCPLCSCAPEESPIAVRRVTFDCSSHSFLSSPAPFLTRPLANACVRYVCYRNKTHMQTWARRTPRSRPTSSVRSLDSRPAFGCLRRTSTTLARTRVPQEGRDTHSLHDKNTGMESERIKDSEAQHNECEKEKKRRKEARMRVPPLCMTNT